MRNLPFVLAFLLTACTPVRRPHPSSPDGSADPVDAGAPDGAPDNGKWGDGGPGTPAPPHGDGGMELDCSDGVKLIYLIDDHANFISFKPDQTDISKSVFKTIGKLDCGVSGYLNMPFSMSVDRTGTAWVEYMVDKQSQMFKVSIVDAKCTPTDYKSGQQGFGLFGMGFVTDEPMGKKETLYIAGGDGPKQTNTNLGTLGIPDFAVAKLAAMTGQPELTGNSLAELWGFFANNDSNTRVRISQIDKKTGAESKTIELNQDLGGQALAWAFANYGGDFWVFLSRDPINRKTTIYQVGKTGGVKAHYDLDYLVVGAGVSTCAPTTPPPPIP